MKLLLIIGAINGFIAVALGAFGAHGLEGKLTEKQLNTWEKAVNYQMFHTGAIFVTALLMTQFQSGSLSWAGWMFTVGIILFSGSLYLYSTIGAKMLAMITPFGGVAFLVGWVLLGIAVIRHL